MSPRASLWLVPALAGCGQTQVNLVFPPETATSLLIKRDEITILDPASTVRFDADGPLTLLHYLASASALALEPEADGKLRLALPEEPRWPLPQAEVGSVYDANLEAFTGTRDAAELRSLADGLFVPVAPCGTLERESSHAVTSSLATGIEGLASVGDTLLLAAVLSDPVQRRVLWFREGLTRAIALPGELESGARLWVFNDGQTFLIAEVSSHRTRVHRASIDGAIELISAAESSTSGFDLLDHFPGTRTIFGLKGKELWLLDVDSARWSLLRRFSARPSADECPGNSEDQGLYAADSDHAVVGVGSSGLHRVSVSGESEDLLVDAQVGAICRGAYVRFESGAEFAYVVHRRDANAPERIFLWRQGPSDPWSEMSFPDSLTITRPVAGRVLALLQNRDELIVVSHEAKRPEQPPRECSTLSGGTVLRYALDGARGFAVRAVGGLLQVASFRVR